MKQKSYYYNVAEDLNNYPDNWCYIIFGGRNTGKTYSSLSYVLDNKTKFVYAKRTAKDVEMVCSGNSLSKKMKATIDLSPFKSINRDRHTNVRAFQIEDGLGAFFNCNDENEPVGQCIGYVMAISTAGKFKGFDLSECDIFIFDEFVPKMWDRKMAMEGEAVLDMYKTISRDREHRGLPALKLICLANADNCASPLTNTLEITDQIAEMSLCREAFKNIDERGILIHRIIDNDDFREKEEQSAIYKAMKDTAWGKMSLDNDFGFNDFSQVGKGNLRKYKCICMYLYKHDEVFIYYNSERDLYAVTKSRTTENIPMFDLSLESDQRHFWSAIGFTLLMAHEYRRVVFETYTMYDMVVRYKNYFKI